MLSAYGASLSSTPTPKEVFQAFDMELAEPDVAAPRLLSCLRAAQRQQGDAVDLALCFVALSRAVRLRARMVRSLLKSADSLRWTQKLCGNSGLVMAAWHGF